MSSRYSAFDPSVTTKYCAAAGSGVAQAVLFVGGDEGGRTGSETRCFAGDRDLDRAADDQEHFFAHMVMGWVGRGVGLEHSFVDFEVVTRVGAALEDGPEGSLAFFFGAEFFECADDGGQGFF